MEYSPITSGFHTVMSGHLEQCRFPSSPHAAHGSWAWKPLYSLLSLVPTPCWAMPCSATEVQSGSEWLCRWHSRLNPWNFNFLHFYRLAKGRGNFFFFFFLKKGMNPGAAGDGLHWSNFLFTIEKKKALDLLESFCEIAQKKQVFLLSLISSASFLPLHTIRGGLFDIRSSICWGCSWH